jgi:hypothetical protein
MGIISRTGGGDSNMDIIIKVNMRVVMEIFNLQSINSNK